MTITFDTDFGLRAGFNGLYTTLWRLENVMDHANLWRKFKDVTRRDPWRSIHDVLKLRHRCHFMTKFWRSVTKIDRHRPRDFFSDLCASLASSSVDFLVFSSSSSSRSSSLRFRRRLHQVTRPSSGSIVVLVKSIDLPPAPSSSSSGR
jgi:hypothetical protein